MKFIQKHIILLLFSLSASFSILYPMEEEEAKTSIEIAQQLEQAFVHDQGQFQTVLNSIVSTNNNFIEQLNILAEIIPLLENADLITHLCSTIVTAITQQEQNSELYNQAVKNMVPVVDFLINKKHLQALSQIIILYNTDERWVELCDRIKIHINELVAENATRGYALKRKSDTSFYKKAEPKKQKVDGEEIPSLIQLCTSCITKNVQSGSYDSESVVRIFDFALEPRLPTIENSCLGVLYQEAQEQNKKSFLATAQWLENLNLSSTQMEALRNHIVNNSKALRALLLKLEAATKLITQFELLGPSYESALSSDGNVLALQERGNNIIKLFNCKTGKLLQEVQGLSGPVFVMALSCDGKKLITNSLVAGSATFRLWDCDTATCIKEYTFTNNDLLSALAVNANKKIMALGFENGTIQLYNMETNGIKNLISKGTINLLQFSDDGKRLISSATNETRLWDLETDKSIMLYTKRIDGCLLSENFVAYNRGNSAKLFNLQTNQYYNLQSRDILNYFKCIKLLAFSPGETILATTGNNSGAICLWDSQTGQHIKTIQCPTNRSISSLVFNSDGESFICLPKCFLLQVGGAFVDFKDVIYIYNFIDKQILADLDIETLLWLEYLLSADPITVQMEIFLYNRDLYEKLPDEIKRYLDSIK